ncbi:uncharacterized protein [Branchiostoma lanceolatum]|uniref:uncharacterized protein n=1 Tax=Branchiostoma lanceolatum TaxID=7740 RepID=UPI00345160B0
MSERSDKKRHKSHKSSHSSSSKSRSRESHKSDKRPRQEDLPPRFKSQSLPPHGGDAALSRARGTPLPTEVRGVRDISGIPAALGKAGSPEPVSPRQQHHHDGGSSPVIPGVQEFPVDLGELRDTLGVNVLQQEQNNLRVAVGVMAEEFKGMKDILHSIAGSVGAKRRTSAAPSEAETGRSKRPRLDVSSGDESSASAASSDTFVPRQREPADPEKMWTARSSVAGYADEYFSPQKRKPEDVTFWRKKYLLPTNAPKSLTAPSLDSATSDILKSVNFSRANEQKLAGASGVDGRCSPRPTLVERQPSTLQSSSNSLSGDRCGGRERRLAAGLGRFLKRFQHGRRVVLTGRTSSHQPTRDVGGHVSGKVLLQGQNQRFSPDKIRQFDGSVVYQPPGRHEVSSPVDPCSRAVELLRGEKSPFVRRVCTGSRQRESGPQIEELRSIDGMAAVPRGLSGHSHEVPRSPFGGCSGPLCVTAEQEVPELRLMGARPRVGGDRRIRPGLEAVESVVRVSSFQLDRPSIIESPNGQSQSASDCTSLGHGHVVPYVARDVHASTAAVAETSEPSHTANGRIAASSGQHAQASRVDCLRRQYRQYKFSEEVTKVLLASWRPKTTSLYASVWRRWARWCGARRLDPISAPLGKVLQFLKHMFNKGLQYRTLNVYRSAISSAHVTVEGSPLGAHPLVTRFMKGIFELRPPVPKHTFIWDVSVVLKLLKRLSPAKCLSSKQLTLKVVMLVALTSAGREQSLALMDTAHMESVKDGLSFGIYKVTKTSRPGLPSHCLFLAKFEQKEICPVFYMRAYLSRTAQFRSDSDTRVFRALVKPHHAVGSATVARWLKMVLADAGVNTKEFSGHSVRSAATSTAYKAGVSAKEIMKAANWSNFSTFEKFYNKPSQHSGFGSAVLASASKSC